MEETKYKSYMLYTSMGMKHEEQANPQAERLVVASRLQVREQRVTGNGHSVMKMFWN